MLNYQNITEARVSARLALHQDVLGVLTTLAVWGALAAFTAFLLVGVVAWALLVGAVI